MIYLFRGLLVVTLGLLLFIVGCSILLGRASAQDGARGHGHAEHHDVYRSLTNPVTGMSCCNAQTPDDPNGDCRPGSVWRDLDGRIKARVGGQTMTVPESALIPSEKAPHPPVGMICERWGHFYCVALSGAGG